MGSGGNGDDVGSDAGDADPDVGATVDVKENDETPDIDELLAPKVDETRELDESGDSPALPIFVKIHPLGFVAAAVLVVAVIGHLAFDTDRLAGNFGIGHWITLVVLLGLSVAPAALNAVRLALESLTSVTVKIVWILAWAVFVVQLINVVTRYLNPFFDQDILVGQLTSLAWQLFALISLLGLNYGVKAEVNPRIDFWWAAWTDRTKAWLDFVMHTIFFLPFLWVSIQVLQTSAAGALGKRRGDGTWPSGFRVWETWEQSGDADQLPTGPIKAIILVGFVLFFIQIIAQVIKNGFVLMGKREYGDLAARDEFQRIE